MSLLVNSTILDLNLKICYIPYTITQKKSIFNRFTEETTTFGVFIDILFIKSQYGFVYIFKEVFSGFDQSDSLLLW